jgi:hypothetical protein
MAQWRYVFAIACILNVFCTSVFTMFGSGEVQSWNEPKKKDEKEGEETEAPLKPLKATV